MSGTEDGDKRSRGAGRSGSAGSIGKELGDDLDFEADALLDSLLSDAPPPLALPLSTRPPAAAAPSATASAVRMSRSLRAKSPRSATLRTTRPPS